MFNPLTINHIAVNPMTTSLLNQITMTSETIRDKTTMSFSGKPPTKNISQLLEAIDEVLSLYPRGNHVIKFDFEKNTFIMSITFNSSEASRAIQ